MGDFGGKRNTNGFDKNPQNIGKGRKKKIYTILKEKGYSSDDIRTAFGELAWYNTEELKKARNDQNLPVIMRIVANQFYLSLHNGDFAKIKEILEHSIGKPKQEVENNDSVVVKFENVSKQFPDGID